jgi:ribosomal protein L12E/L44/L45/RPP1/RPP2
MRLFEFSDNDPLRIKLTAVANQLSTQNEPMTTDEFLTVLNKNGITVDKADLFNMIKQDPLKNIIKDIEKDTVVFKGQEQDTEGAEQGSDENEKIRQQMASKQIK